MPNTVSNTRNVDALCALLSDYIMGDGHGTDLDNIELAQWLAARGVLVPSVLTGDDCREVAIAGKDADGVWDYALATDVREELERIAKGEQ